MRKLCSAVVLFLVSISSRAILAQQTKTASSETTPIAVIDVPRIFRQHPRFKQQMDLIKQEVENFEKLMMEERQTIMKQRERQQSYGSGSPEYKQLEEDIARKMADQQVRAQLKRKDLAERETKAYFDAYREISQEVGRVASHYGINLVLNYDGQTMTSTDQRSVMAGINRAVVYQRNLDLTDLVASQFGTPQTKTTAAATSASLPTSALRTIR